MSAASLYVEDLDELRVAGTRALELAEWLAGERGPFHREVSPIVDAQLAGRNPLPPTPKPLPGQPALVVLTWLGRELAGGLLAQLALTDPISTALLERAFEPLRPPAQELLERVLLAPTLPSRRRGPVQRALTPVPPSLKEAHQS